MDWKRHNVESQMMYKIGYQKNTATLEIFFNDNQGNPQLKPYHYYDVPENIWNDLNLASSKGRFFLNNIKNVFLDYKNFNKE